MSTRRSKHNRRDILRFATGVGGALLMGDALGPTAARADVSGNVTVNFYNVSNDWNKACTAVIEGFSKVNPNVKVTVAMQPSDGYYDKLKVQYAAGNAPDISINDMEQVVPLAARGMLVDLKPYYDRDKIDLGAYWYPVAHDWSWKGALYGGLLYAGGQALYVNKTLLAAAGLQAPAPDWTWDDLLKYAQAMTDPSKRQWGVHISPIDPPYWSTSFVHGAGGTILSDDRTKCTLTTPEARAGLQFIVDLIHAHKVMPVPSTSTNSGEVNPFMAGKVGLYFGGTWDEAAIRTSGFDWDFAHMPVNAKTGIRRVQEGSNAWSMLSTSNNKDAAWEAIKYLMGPDAQLALAGLGLPGLKSVVDSAQFKDLHKPQAIATVIDDYAQYGHDYYTTPDAAQWWDAVTQEFSVMWTGEASVADATTRACSQIEQIFAKRPPEWNAK